MKVTFQVPWNLVPCKKIELKGTQYPRNPYPSRLPSIEQPHCHCPTNTTWQLETTAQKNLQRTDSLRVFAILFSCGKRKRAFFSCWLSLVSFATSPEEVENWSSSNGILICSRSHWNKIPDANRPWCAENLVISCWRCWKASQGFVRNANLHSSFAKTAQSTRPGRKRNRETKWSFIWCILKSLLEWNVQSLRKWSQDCWRPKMMADLFGMNPGLSGCCDASVAAGRCFGHDMDFWSVEKNPPPHTPQTKNFFIFLVSKRPWC